MNWHRWLLRQIAIVACCKFFFLEELDTMDAFDFHPLNVYKSKFYMNHRKMIKEVTGRNWPIHFWNRGCLLQNVFRKVIQELRQHKWEWYVQFHLILNGAIYINLHLPTQIYVDVIVKTANINEYINIMKPSKINWVIIKRLKPLMFFIDLLLFLNSVFFLF